MDPHRQRPFRAAADGVRQRSNSPTSPSPWTSTWYGVTARRNSPYGHSSPQLTGSAEARNGPEKERGQNRRRSGCPPRYRRSESGRGDQRCWSVARRSLRCRSCLARTVGAVRGSGERFEESFCGRGGTGAGAEGCGQPPRQLRRGEWDSSSDLIGPITARRDRVRMSPSSVTARPESCRVRVPGRCGAHLIIDAKGIPLAVTPTGGNRNDVIQLIPLLQAVPPVHGKRGRPRCRPDVMLSDRGYDHGSYHPPGAPATHPHNRRLTDPTPGPGRRRSPPGLVPTDDPGVALRLDSLTHRKVSFFHTSTAPSSRSMARRTACCRLQPCRRFSTLHVPSTSRVQET